MASRQSRRQFMRGSVVGGAAALPFEARPQKAAESETPRAHMVQMINGYRTAQMLHVAATLRIADELAQGPRTVRELAAATQTHADSLYRLLRTLAGMGVFAEEQDLRFRLTPSAELLRSGTPDSIRALAAAAGEEWMWRPWGALLDSVRTGETAFDRQYGKNTFEWFEEHPAAARIFDEYQTQHTAMTSDAVVAAYDFSTARTIVDVAGGEGVLIATILRRNPGPHAILFELEHVIASARTKLDRAIASRCGLVAGDFFKAVPEGCDLYILKAILHGWDDDHCALILANCRRAMLRESNLLVVEDIVCDRNLPCFAKEADIMMMVRTGGRNRTDREYRDLLAKSGFATARVIPSRGGPSIIEAVPRG